MSRVRPRHAGKLVLGVWILVALLYFYISYDYVRISMNDKTFGEYLQYVVQIAGDDRRPTKEVRALILVKAEELGLPIRGDQIAILGGGDNLNVAVDYTVDIEVPVFEKGLYTKVMQHKVAYRKLN
jgi:hypothetical protein